ncbi:MAG: asparagine synthase-related protein [Chloroflexota bacterium]
MSAIFGIFYRDGRPIDTSTLAAMQTASTHWGRDGDGLWQEGCAGLGQARTFSTPEAVYEKLPLWDAGRGLAFTVAARLDNREELIHQFSVSSDQSQVPDSDLIYRAYLKWGEDCVQHIYGDWAFAVWNPKERSLYLARDHFGNTALYYYLDAQMCAFASERKALLALKLAPLEMDELYLAQILISWPAYHGERSIYQQIQRLPPAHTLKVTPEKNNVRQYWRMEDTPILRLAKRQDYVEAFREKFDQAVRARLRSVGGVATTLSGGLDSGSVTVTAAALLRREGKRLAAFTSVPLFDTRPYVDENHFGDEFSFAQAAAQFAGNVDLVPITAENITPIQAIRHVLAIHDEPSHAAGNLFWLYDMERTVAAQGFRVLLTGQLGNASISWTGDPSAGLFQSNPREWTKNKLKQALPFEILKAWQRWHTPQDWFRGSAIQPEFAKRLNLLELRLSDPGELPFTPLEMRMNILKPGKTFLGALHAQMGAAHGLEIRDPSGDARLVAFTLSVPDDIFSDPKTGMDRWLVREAMQDRLADEVRLNRRRGRQAGDLVPRLRNSADEVESALAEIESGPASQYLDSVQMRQIWQMVQTQDSKLAFLKSVTTLTRGIMAGLWVNEFYARHG